MTRRRSRLPWRVLLQRRGSHRKRRIRDHRAADAAPCWRPSCQDRSCPSALDLLLVGNLCCPFGIGQVRCHAKGKVSQISYSELIRTSLEIANSRDFAVTSARTAVSSPRNLGSRQYLEDVAIGIQKIEAAPSQP